MKRNDSGTELRHSHLLQVVHLITFFVVWLLDSFVFRFSTFLADFVPLVVRVVLFLGIIAIGSVLIAKAHQLLFKNRPPGLVTTGVFAHVRHPMYLGIVLTYLGYVVGTSSLLTLIPWLLVVHLYVKMASYEERELEKRFGEKYVEYKKRVPKWIPR